MHPGTFVRIRTMSNIEDQIRQARAGIAQAQTKKTRAAVELDTAKSRLADARAVLKDEFGVVTTEDARTKLAELKAALDAALSDIDSALAEAGA